MASDMGYAVQCLSPEYRSIWFWLVFFSTVSCFWVLRKIIIMIIIIVIVLVLVLVVVVVVPVAVAVVVVVIVTIII